CACTQCGCLTRGTEVSRAFVLLKVCTGCPQASCDRLATDRHGSAYPALLQIGRSWVAPWALNLYLTKAFCVSMKISGNRSLRIWPLKISFACLAAEPSGNAQSA